MKVSMKMIFVLILSFILLLSVTSFLGCGEEKKPEPEKTTEVIDEKNEETKSPVETDETVTDETSDSVEEVVLVPDEVTSGSSPDIDVFWFDTGTREIDISLYPWEKTIFPITLINNSDDDVALDFDCDNLWVFYNGVSSLFNDPLIFTPDFENTINLPISFSMQSDPYGTGTETVEILISSSENSEPIVLSANLTAKNTDHIPLAREIWNIEIDAGEGGIYQTFADNENLIVVLDTVRENMIPEEYICFDAETGIQKWKLERVDDTEGFYGDESYAYKAFYKPEEEKLIVFESTKIICINTGSGEMLWETENTINHNLFETEMFGSVAVISDISFDEQMNMTKEPGLILEFNLETGEYWATEDVPEGYIFDEKNDVMLNWSDENQDNLVMNEDYLSVNYDGVDGLSFGFLGRYMILDDKLYQTAATFEMGDFYYHTSFVCYDRFSGDELYFWDFGAAAPHMQQYQIYYPCTTTLWSFGDRHHVFCGNYIMSAGTGELEYLLDRREYPNQLSASVYADSVYSWEQADGQEYGLGGILILRKFGLE